MCSCPLMATRCASPAPYCSFFALSPRLPRHLHGWEQAERDCHYFEEIAAEGEATGLGTRLLRSIAPPASLDIRRGEYCGPIVQPDDVAALKRRWPR
mmetsp:Transcript_15245/g.34069  ORF Transcript_15245/g.34069 Transcript_15245/m.34069 type:complete len:97 (+) Transcript_15245:732-1022(+)